MVDQPAPRVSVVVTTYKRAHRLATTLESILGQSFVDFELIVSDDCSGDGTAGVVREFSRCDPRVRYRSNSSRLRMPGNLNAAIVEARGEYIANLHDDDIYRSDLLAKWSAALDRHRSAAFVFNSYLARLADGRERVYGIQMPECLSGREFLRRVYLKGWGSPVFGTVMARRACYEAVGPFDPRYSISSDIEMWVRLASRYDVAFIDEPLITVTAREPNHVLVGHRWWEIANDVLVKRLAVDVAYPGSRRHKAIFEVKARWHYAWQALPALKHGRWSDVYRSMLLALTGRDAIPPPV